MYFTRVHLSIYIDKRAITHIHLCKIYISIIFKCVFFFVSAWSIHSGNARLAYLSFYYTRVCESTQVHIYMYMYIICTHFKNISLNYRRYLFRIGTAVAARILQLTSLITRENHIDFFFIKIYIQQLHASMISMLRINIRCGHKGHARNCGFAVELLYYIKISRSHNLLFSSFCFIYHHRRKRELTLLPYRKRYRTISLPYHSLTILLIFRNHRTRSTAVVKVIKR